MALAAEHAEWIGTGGPKFLDRPVHRHWLVSQALALFDFFLAPSFNPAGLTTTSGFFIVVVLTVQGLTGWEAAVPLAEETENPRRNVPRCRARASFLSTDQIISVPGRRRTAARCPDTITS